MIRVIRRGGLLPEICGTTKQKDMRFFALSFNKVILRFFLMMGCVIVGLFTGQALLAVLALPLFLSAIMGVSFMPEGKEAAEESSTVIVMNDTLAKNQQAA